MYIRDMHPAATSVNLILRSDLIELARAMQKSNRIKFFKRILQFFRARIDLKTVLWIFIVYLSIVFYTIFQPYFPSQLYRYNYDNILLAVSIFFIYVIQADA